MRHKDVSVRFSASYGSQKTVVRLQLQCVQCGADSILSEYNSIIHTFEKNKIVSSLSIASSIHACINSTGMQLNNEFGAPLRMQAKGPLMEMFMIKLKSPLTYLSVATLVALVGCGGGSGGGDDKSPTDPTVTEPGSGENGNGNGNEAGSGVTLAGVATKGVLKGARVTAYELDGSGERLSNPVGTIDTDSEGGYELELTSNYEGGPVEVEVSVVEGATKMVCDARRCGESERFSDIDLPADFVLNAIVEKPAEGNRIEAAVTAWSSMAAKRTKALISDGGKDVASARKQASAEVSQLVGFDVERTGSKGLSQVSGASAAETQYAVMNAAVAELLYKDNGEAGLGEKLQKFTAALQDGSAGNADDGFDMGGLSQAISEVVNSTEGLDTEALDALSNQSAQYDATGEDGFKPDYDEDLVVDENTTADEKIAAYKTFVTDVRTWVSNLEATDTESIAAAADIDAEAIKASVDGKVQSQFQFVGEVLSQVSLFADANPDTLVTLLNEGGVEQVSIVNSNGDTVGTVDIEAAYDQGLVLSLSGIVTGESGDAFAPFALALHTSIAKGSLEAHVTDTARVGGFLNELAQTTQLTLVGHVGDVSSDHFVQLRNTNLSVELSEALQASEQGAFDAEEADAAFQSATLSGGITVHSDGNELNGDVEAALVRINDDARLLEDYNSGPMNLERLRFTGDLTSADGRYAAGITIGARISNAASFDAFTWSDYSGARLVLEGEIPFSPIEELGTPVAQDAAASVAWYHKRWTGDYSFNVQNYYETGEVRPYFYVLNDEVDSDLHTQVEAIVLDALPETLTLEYYDETTDELVTFDYNLADRKTSIVLDQADTSWSNGDIFLSLRILEPGDLPGEVDRYSVPTSDQFLYGYLRKNSRNGEVSVSLDLNDANLLENIAGAFQSATGHSLEVLSDFSILRYSRSSFSITSTDSAEYDRCENDPEGYVARRFDSDFEESIFPGCAIRTLTAEPTEEQALGQAERELLDQAVSDAIQARLALADSLSEKVDVTSYYVDEFTETGLSVYFAEIRLPNLETADNFLKGSVTVSARLAMPELPEAQLTATFNRSAYEGGKVRITTDWDGGNYTLEASGDLAESDTLNLRFFNPQGYELKLTAAVDDAGEPIITGDALIDGEVIGTVETRDGVPVIVYPSGDADEIESLY